MNDLDFLPMASSPFWCSVSIFKRNKTPVWKCKHCSEKAGRYKRQCSEYGEYCTGCTFNLRWEKKERRKRQEELASSVAGGLAGASRMYRDRSYDLNDVAKEAMKIADAILSHEDAT